MAKDEKTLFAAHHDVVAGPRYVTEENLDVWVEDEHRDRLKIMCSDINEAVSIALSISEVRDLRDALTRWLSDSGNAFVPVRPPSANRVTKGAVYAGGTTPRTPPPKSSATAEEEGR